MPRKRQREKSVFQKSDFSDESEDDETKNAGFVLDPEKIFDELPQPYRLIDKTLNYIFDKAWEAIEELEIRKNELGVSGRIPLFECAGKIPDIFQPELICCSVDGKYTFIASKNGVLYVVDTVTSSVIATNEELQGLSITSLSAGYFDESKNFVFTLQENGSAAIFALSNGNLHLLRVFNEETSVKNSATTYIKMSFDGNYIGVGWKIALKSSWLDIYKVPKEFWINEIEIADKKIKKQVDLVPPNDEEIARNPGNTLENDSSDSENESKNSRPASPGQNDAHTGFVPDTSFSKPSLVLKVRSPIDVVPNPASSASSALKNIDPDTVIGTGNNHVLLQQYFDNSLSVFKYHHEQYLQYLADEEVQDPCRLPTVHFLTPGKFIPAGFESAPDHVNSILVHWSDSCHGYLYSLGKTTKDVERKTDLVLTTASKILVSAMSVCRSLISFGLENNNIVTWNILQGSPLSVVNVPSIGPVISLHFVPSIKFDNRKNQGSALPVKLLACFEYGGLHVLQYNQDGAVTIDGQANVDKLSPSSLRTKDPVVQVTYLPNSPKLVIVQRSSGRIVIMDTSTNTPKCQVGLIKPLTTLQGFCYAHQTSTLYIRGGQKDEYDEEIEPESVCIFTMNVGALPALKCYYEEDVEILTTMLGKSFDKHIEEMEKDRIATQEKRQRRRCTRWRQFESELKRMKKTTSTNSMWFSNTIET